MKLRCPYCKHVLTEPKSLCPNCKRAMVIPGSLRKMTLRQRKRAKDRIYREFERKQQQTISHLPDFHPGRNPVMIFGILLVLIVMGAMLIGRARVKFEPSKITRTPEMTAAKDLRNLYIAIERFNLDCKRYPTSEEGLNALIIDTGDWMWRRPYVTLIRSDPWGRPYEYEAGSNGFTLLSLGRDGVRGTADDIIPKKPAPREISLKLVAGLENTKSGAVTNGATAATNPPRPKAEVPPKTGEQP
jgi:general secretion pathway protein G